MSITSELKLCTDNSASSTKVLEGCAYKGYTYFLRQRRCGDKNKKFLSLKSFELP